MMCRSLNEESPLLPGYIGGYSCSMCLLPVQMGPSGQQRIRKEPDYTVMCTDCGVTVLEGSHDPRVEIGPDAARQADLVRHLARQKGKD